MVLVYVHSIHRHFEQNNTLMFLAKQYTEFFGETILLALLEREKKGKAIEHAIVW